MDPSCGLCAHFLSALGVTPLGKAAVLVYNTDFVPGIFLTTGLFFVARWSVRGKSLCKHRFASIAKYRIIGQ